VHRRQAYFRDEVVVGVLCKGNVVGPSGGGSEERECGAGNCRTVQIRGTWYKEKS
jgi:hypothetical protein